MEPPAVHALGITAHQLHRSSPSLRGAIVAHSGRLAQRQVVFPYGSVLQRLVVPSLRRYVVLPYGSVVARVVVPSLLRQVVLPYGSVEQRVCATALEWAASSAISANDTIFMAISPDVCSGPAPKLSRAAKRWGRSAELISKRLCSHECDLNHDARSSGEDMTEPRELSLGSVSPGR